MATGFNYTLNASNIPVANYTGYTGPSGGNYVFWTVNANTIQSGGPTGVNPTLVKNNLSVNGSVSGLTGSFSNAAVGVFATGYNSVNATTGFTGSYGNELVVAGSTTTSSLTFGDNSSIMTGNLPLDYTTFGGTGWVQNTSVLNINCNGGICMSSSGQYQTVGTTLTIYVSSNYGQTWSAPSGPSSLTSVCMSSSGKYQLGTANGAIFYSTNFGQTWVNYSVPSLFWYGSAISSSGQYQSAVANSNTIYYSNNYGQTWLSSNAPTAGWLGIAMSSSGKYQTAVSNSGQGIWYSTNFGQTWLNSSSLSTTFVAMSSSGQYQSVVGTGAGYIYYSTNYGLNWNQSNSPLSNFEGICMSASGQYQLSCINGTSGGTSGVYYSIDYGVSWTQISLSILPLNNWSKICMSSSGQFQSACVKFSSGGIYTTSLYNSPIYGNITFQGPSTNSSITTSGTSTLTLNSTGGILLNPLGGTVKIGDNVSVTGSSANTQISIGQSANFSSGVNNMSIGINVGRSAGTGQNNTILGQVVGQAMTTSSQNVLIGVACGNALTSGDNNVAIGVLCANALTTGGENTCIGNGSGNSLTTGTGNTCIGRSAITSSVGAVEEIVLGTNQVGKGNNSAVIKCNQDKFFMSGYTAGSSIGITSSGNITSTSDSRLKNSIQYLTKEGNMDIIMRLKPASYKLNQDLFKEKWVGFIAQDLMKVIPNCVDCKKYEYLYETDPQGKPLFNQEGQIVYKKDENGKLMPRYKTVDFNEIWTRTVLAVQEQQTEITELKAQVASLKATVDMLVSRINQ